MVTKKYDVVISCLVCLVMQACQQGQQQDVQYRIKKVEENLVGPVQLEGQLKWNLEKRMEYYKIQGLSMAVIKDYKIDWAKGYGLADAEDHRKVTTETVFQAASISKSLNGVGVLKLAQDGKIDLKADINTYLTSWKFPYDDVSKGKKITVTNLLSHTAGLTVHGFPGYSKGETLPMTAEILDGKKPANSRAVRSMFEPDLRPEYSGGGTTISQCIVTDVTHQRYDDFMWETVLKPLGMTSSFYTQPAPESKKSFLATAYRSNGNEVEGKFHIYPEEAAAGLWTNPTDLANYIIETQLSLQGKSDKVLSQSFTKLRLTPYRDEVALGVFIAKKGAAQYFGHGGANEGFRCQYLGSLENGNGVVVMVNSDNDGIIQEIVNSVATVYEWKDFYNPQIKKIVTLTQQQLKRLEGYYELQTNKDVHLQLTSKSNQLILKQLWDGREITFEPESELDFFCMDFPFPLKFSKNAAGEVTQVMAFERDVWKKVKDYKPEQK